MTYEYKIEVILGNKLEYNGDNKKAVEDVKTWLHCEWQCGMIEDMQTLSELLDRVDSMAQEMIKNF